MDIMEKLFLAGLIPVIKVDRAEDAVPLCRALSEGGLPVAEITFRTAAAADAIARVSKELPDVILGAGTVLTREQVDSAAKAGAQYIVSPGLNPAVAAYCAERGLPILPGCSNASDIETALSLGIRTVKFFPAEAIGGLPLIKALSAPYGDVRFVPTGGVNEKNLAEYLAFHKVAACGGSFMVPDAAVKAGDWDTIRVLTRNAVSLVHGFEVRHIGINHPDAQAALTAADWLSGLFAMPVKEGNSSVMVGTGIELVKSNGRGAMGHIAVAVNSLPRAKAYLMSKGALFDETSAVVKDGKCVAVYLTNEISGFAVHLLQK